MSAGRGSLQPMMRLPRPFLVFVSSRHWQLGTTAVFGRRPVCCLRRLRGSADLPDDPGAGNLNERAISGPRAFRARFHFELRARIALAEVAHRPIVDQVQGPIGTERRRYGPIDAVDLFGERLITGNFAGRAPVGIMSLLRQLAVEGETRLLEPQSLAWPTEVHQLDVVA